MVETKDIHAAAFREEAYELLAELESALLELERSPDEELVARTFRAMHTIKGSGAMFGFDEISEFTHQVETVYDQVRNGMTPVTNELIGETLKACDLIKAMLDGDGGGDATEKARLVAVFKSITADKGSGSRKDHPEQQYTPEAENDEKIYRIRFKPARNILLTGTDPLSLIEELRCLGECCVTAHVDDIPGIAEIDAESCYTWWDIMLDTNRPPNSVRDVFIFVEDESELKIELVHGPEANRPGEQRLGEILVDRGDVTPETVAEVLKEKKLLGQILVDKGLARKTQVEAALVEQQQVREAQQKRQDGEAAGSIRVPSDKLDNLVNLVGELVTVQARLTQTAAASPDPRLNLIAEEVERLTLELRDSTLSIRMMPIGSTFSKFRRLVRDLSSQLGKEIEMVTDGASTELDKTVIDRLNDPLVHIIRNSIDHGIESPDEREAKGKRREGTVKLTAEHSGDCVVITVQDDGAGLDKVALKAKAVEKGIIPEAAELSEKELLSLIFAPGISTAKKITGVSGRGVGMDVVKQAITSLRGTIEISSERGAGTTIRIKLPLTLAIIGTLLVKVGGDFFLMPLSFVEECVELTREQVVSAHGRNIANVRGQMVPYIPLRERFSLPGATPDIQQVVVTQVNGEHVGILVDNVMGEHQTVIKSLGKAYRNICGISGATILGDGTVALILDIPQLVKQG